MSLYFGTYQRLGVPVTACAREVIKAASRKLRKDARRDRNRRVPRHAFYRDILECHASAQALVKAFRL